MLKNKQNTDKNSTSQVVIFLKNIKSIASLFVDYKYLLIIAIFFAFGATLFSVIGPKVLANVTNELFYGLQSKIENNEQINFETVFLDLSIAASMFVLSCACQCFQNIISTNISKRVCYELRKKLIHKINCLPVGYFEKNSKGNFMSRVINDVDMLAQNISSVLIDFITAITMIVGSVIMMYIINYILASVIIFLIPVSFLLIMVIVKFSQKHFLNQQNTIGEVNAYVEEHITGHALIDIFNKQEETINEFNKINTHLYKESIKAKIISRIASPLFTFCNNLAYVVVIILGAYFSIIGSFTVGGIQAFIQYIGNFTSPINSIISIFNLIQQMAAASMRIEEFLNLEEEQDNKETKEISIAQSYSTKEPIIRFKDIKFSYDKEIQIIDDISFDIYKGQTIAIIGPTGAGKTTLAKLLMRFYDVDNGSIELYGNNIKNINRNQLRNQISMVLQDIWLFSGSIEDNIKYGKDTATFEDVKKSAKISCIDSFIEKLADKYNTQISERAKNLSYGQKQLISIARAIIADREILILDEATSSVDTKTEDKLYRAFNNLINEKTAIVIAHRLSTIKNADLILVVNNGKIIEKGNHKELLSKQGFYYDLIQSSTK